MARVSDTASAFSVLRPTVADRLIAAASSLKGGIAILALSIVWEWVARSGAVTPFQLPALTAVFETIFESAASGDLWVSIGLTLYRSILGFLIAAVAGIGLGVLISHSRAARWFFDPIISVTFPMPKIVFMPIVVLWLGFGDAAKIWLIVVDAIFPVLTATIAATQAVQRDLIWSARSMGASSSEVLREVVIPAALPEILTGLQVALPIALIVCIVVEMLTGGLGLGAEMINAANFSNSRGLFAHIMVTAVVGYILIKGMALVRRRLLRWHQENHRPPTV